MSNISCIILDDEARNVKLLSGMLQMHCSQLNLIAAETDSKKGIQLIKEHQPQILFLDIEMPGMNGFETLKNIAPINAEIIFVTAYSQYAIEAFEYHAAGYITKPINADKLVAAVNSAIKRIEEKNINKNLSSLMGQMNQQSQSDKIPLATGSGMLFVKIADILYCESSGNYTHFYLQDGKKIIVSRQLGEYEKLLPENCFMRIHDKFIINLNYIKEYKKGSGGEVVLENGIELPVATRRKEDFLSRFEKWIKRKSGE